MMKNHNRAPNHRLIPGIKMQPSKGGNTRDVTTLARSHATLPSASEPSRRRRRQKATMSVAKEPEGKKEHIRPPLDQRHI
jgi:hypothetical protein